jgi:hypothetical protein
LVDHHYSGGFQWCTVLIGIKRKDCSSVSCNGCGLHLGPWLVCGDFNLIYRASDKSNSRLYRSLMSAFRNALNSMELTLLHLQGRLFTWSSEQHHPTLCWDRPSPLVGINRRLLLGSTVGSCWDRPSALLPRQELRPNTAAHTRCLMYFSCPIPQR